MIKNLVDVYHLVIATYKILRNEFVLFLYEKKINIWLLIQHMKVCGIYSTTKKTTICM